MTDNLQDVCERHYLIAKKPRTRWRITYHVPGLAITPNERFDSEADAVCFGLKRAYGITTRCGPGDGVNVWGAECPNHFSPHAYPSELEAVMALADQLWGDA